MVFRWASGVPAEEKWPFLPDFGSVGYAEVPYREPLRALLQLRVLRLGLHQDGDVGVGVFPEREEIFVGGEGAGAGGVGICSPRGSRLQGVGTSHAQMRQRSRPAVPDNPAVVENI